ncbi:hypothetical protein EON65_34545 [archaeon]|nr:MAG: hypothetical protein EON65_34545 [archaeon]
MVDRGHSSSDVFQKIRVASHVAAGRLFWACSDWYVAPELPDTSTSIQHHLDTQAQEDNVVNSGLSDSESVAESTIAKHLLNIPEEQNTNKLGQFDFSVDPTASRRISAETLEALEGVRANTDTPDQNTTLAARNRAYNTGGRGLKRAAAVHRRGSLFNKSIDVGQSDSQKESSQPQVMDTPASPVASTKTESKQSQPTTKSGKGNKHTSLNQFFFIVELIDPQLNFLDTDSHSSLIIVAGRSSLEGKRMNSATLPSLANTNAVVADTEEHIDMNTPKRRQEIRLRMDNVSAYTVPTANDDDEDDEVYWKNTQSSVESYQLRPLQSTAKAALNKSFPTPVFDRKMSDQNVAPGPQKKNLTINTEPTGSFLSSPDSLNSNSSNVSMIPTPRKVYKFRPDKVDPSTMQMAIKDFQIRAVYIFWTDVTVSEAKELKIIRSKEDMICTFRLELPNLAVDINSKQFHITMNVIKNVMLVPPPHLQNKRAAENAAANSNVIELQRNPDVLQKYDIKASNAPLDINYKNSRDEIKAYVDECLGSNLFDLSNQQTERYTEVFIGRLTWVLRNSTITNFATAPAQPGNLYSSPLVNNTSSASSTSAKGEKEYELVESGFIGIYATLTFTKSR